MSQQQLNSYLASLEPDEAQAWRLVVQETDPHPIARMQGNSVFITVLFRFYCSFIPVLLQFYSGFYSVFIFTYFFY